MAAALLFEVYGILALVDGFYFHLWRFRLFAPPASRREHVAHTLHVVLFGPMALLMFVVNCGGWLLWLLVVVIVLDLAGEFASRAARFTATPCNVGRIAPAARGRGRSRCPHRTPAFLFPPLCGRLQRPGWYRFHLTRGRFA